ncbi:MAG: FeoB-associated Cys-rich membrane protein [Christensenellales bacterium]
MATIIVLIVLAVILFFLGRSFIRDRKNGGCSGCRRLPRLRRRQELPCEIIMPLSSASAGDFGYIKK